MCLTELACALIQCSPVIAVKRVDCPYCGRLGTLRGERIIKAKAALTTYHCDACNTEWDEREGDSTPQMPRNHKREPRHT